MKSNLIHRIFASTLLTSLLTGCSGSGEGSAKPGYESSGKQQLSEAEWNTRKEPISDTTVVVTKELSTESRKQAEKVLRETTLESLNLPSTLNVNAFTIRSRSNLKTKQAVYFAPKLYFYTTGERAQVKAKQFGDNVLIPLQAILVDGLSKEIISPDGRTKINLPESYQVDQAAVLETLKNRGFDDRTTFGPLDGCPKKFAISVAGKEFDVTPAIVQNSNQCEINRPFTLNLVVPKSFADFIINEALYNNEVDATASFEVLVGYVDAETFIQLDRKKVYESLSASLQGQYAPYGSASVEANLKKIIQSETMNIFIKGNRDETVNQLVKIAMDSFTTPFELKSPADSPKAECENMACVNIEYNQNTESRYLEVAYQQFTTTLTGQTVTSFAKPQQILSPQVALRSADNSTGRYVDNREGQQNQRNLLLTANPGSVIEINMLNTIHQMDNTFISVTTNKSRSCKERDSFTNGCYSHWHTTNVTRTYSGIKYSEPRAVAGNVIGNPAEELVLIFKKSSGVEVECNLSQMGGVGNGSKYIIKMRNTSNCEIFDDELDKDEQVNISFVNRLRDSNKLKQINNGIEFSNGQDFTAVDRDPEGIDTEPMNGPKPSVINEVERSIQLEVEIMLRKYDLTVVQ